MLNACLRRQRRTTITQPAEAKRRRGASTNEMQKCKSKIIYASLLTAVAVAIKTCRLPALARFHLLILLSLLFSFSSHITVATQNGVIVGNLPEPLSDTPALGQHAGKREVMRPGLHLHLWHGIIHYQAFCRLPWQVMQHAKPAGAKGKRNGDWTGDRESSDI